MRSRSSRSSTSWTASSSRRSTTSTAPAERVAGQLVGVGGHDQPAGDPGAHAGGAHPLGHRIGREEAVVDELAEGLAELGLALRDDRGVGDGNARAGGGTARPRRTSRPARPPSRPRRRPARSRGSTRPPRRRPRWRRTPRRPRPSSAVARRRVVTSCCRLRSALGDGGSEGAVVTVAVMAAGLPAARGSLAAGRGSPRGRGGPRRDPWCGASAAAPAPSPSGSRPWRGAGRGRPRPRGRRLERMRRPAPWASSVAARGRSMSPKAPAPARSRRACSRGSSGRGNGMRSMVTRLSEAPGTSTPCQKPMVAKRHVASSAANCSSRRPFGRSRCVRIGTSSRSWRAAAASSSTRKLVNRASVRPPAASIRSPSSSVSAST